MRPDGFVRLDELLGNRRFSGVSKSQVEDVVSWYAKGVAGIQSSSFARPATIRARKLVRRGHEYGVNKAQR